MGNSLFPIIEWGFKAAGWAADKLMSTISANKEHFCDILEHTATTATKAPPPNDRNYKHVSITTPQAANAVIEGLKYKMRMLTVEEQFEVLNIPRTDGNRFSPCEGVWAYRYVKRYGVAYHPNHQITEAEMKPLTDQERKEYRQVLGL